MENNETPEETAERYYPPYPDGIITDEIRALREGFIKGLEVQAERMQSEEDMRKCWQSAYEESFNKWIKGKPKTTFKKWFNQFKKK
jgi:hypothetical protein